MDEQTIVYRDSDGGLFPGDSHCEQMFDIYGNLHSSSLLYTVADPLLTRVHIVK